MFRDSIGCCTREDSVITRFERAIKTVRSPKSNPFILSASLFGLATGFPGKSELSREIVELCAFMNDLMTLNSDVLSRSTVTVALPVLESRRFSPLNMPEIELPFIANGSPELNPYMLMSAGRVPL